MLLIILVVSLIAPKQDIEISVDGGLLHVSSRSPDADDVARVAGIDLEAGDEVKRITDDRFSVGRALEARVFADGKTYEVRMQPGSVGEALEQARVEVGEGDTVYHDGQPVALASSLAPPEHAASNQSANDVHIEVRRAVPFTVVENGQHLEAESSGATVAAALKSRGVRIAPGDVIQPPLSSEMTAGLEVHIEHARPLVVTVPDGKLIVYTIADTVGDALSRSDLPLPDDYRLVPPAQTVVGTGLTVHVIGLSEEQVEETERIESQTVYEPDPDLPYGEQRIRRGQDGVVHRAYAVALEDGQQTGRELISEWFDPEPRDTIVYYSTASAPVAAPLVSSAVAGNWQDLVCSYHWDCEWALAVIQCESGGNPNAYNASGYVGLFQIWEGHGANLRDPSTNIAAAYALYQSGGASHWPNCP